MRIKVFRSWYGVAGFVREGEYDADDPALFGLATYLVEQKHAVEIVELTVIDEGAEESETIEEHPEEIIEGGEPVTGTVEETVDLTTLTKDDLIALAAERGVDLGSNPKRNKTVDEIIELLKAAESE